MVHCSRMLAAALFVFVVLVPCTTAQDDKVFKTITPEAIEKVLQEMKIEFNKHASKKGDEHFFEFTRNSYRVRLTRFSGEELMLDCAFRGASLEKVNQWNTFTRLSRASHHKSPSGEVTMLEYALDISGGATTGTIKAFISRFDDELKRYDKYLGNANDDVILAEVTNDKLENLLKTQGINYQKKANSNGVMMFDFELHGQKLRMYNFGKDLMIDVHFRKIALEEANKYNLNRKFIRVVNYRGKETEYTALEANLDCESGISEGMIRHWFMAFGEEARDFAQHAKKLQESEKK